jgi:prephenate dehydratase
MSSFEPHRSSSVPNNGHVPPKVAYQGVPGAFSETAIRQYWPHGADSIAANTFADALQHVLAGRAEFAAIPVENVIAGPVHAAVAALEALPHLHYHGDVRVDVRLCLMAKPGATLQTLRTVRSHPMALAQSGLFFAQHPWLTAEEHADTAGAASDVARQESLTVAAIASEAAATRYALNILARSVEDMPGNWTRFVIVSAR